MRFPFLLPMALLIVACSAPRDNAEELPTALQEPDVVKDLKGSLTSRGYSKDLVDALFLDVLKQDTALQALLNDLDQQLVAHGDSIERMQRFEAQNRSYYEAALAQHAVQLSDSVEREQQREILSRSRARYDAAMATSRDLLQHYDSAQRRTLELVELIKLKRTLPLMEKYQEQERPSDAVLRAELERIKALEKRLEVVLKP